MRVLVVRARAELRFRIGSVARPRIFSARVDLRHFRRNELRRRIETWEGRRHSAAFEIYATIRARRDTVWLRRTSANRFLLNDAVPQVGSGGECRPAHNKRKHLRLPH